MVPPLGKAADGGAGEFAVGPADVHFECAAGLEALGGAGGPGGGEGGEEGDFAGLALDEHFGHGPGDAEVAVELQGVWVVRRLGSMFIMVPVPVVLRVINPCR